MSIGEQIYSAIPQGYSAGVLGRVFLVLWLVNTVHLWCALQYSFFGGVVLDDTRAVSAENFLGRSSVLKIAFLDGTVCPV